MKVTRQSIVDFFYKSANFVLQVSDEVLFGFARVGRLVSLRAQHCELFTDSGKQR